MCTPKCRGGLGIKNLEAFNLALLSKWRWIFLVGDVSSMWKMVLMERYSPSAPRTNDDDHLKGLKGSSIWWRDIITFGADTKLGKLWFNDVAKKKIQKGDTILFWSDAWFGRESLKTLFPSLYNLGELKQVIGAEMGSWQLDSWSWDRLELDQCFTRGKG